MTDLFNNPTTIAPSTTQQPSPSLTPPAARPASDFEPMSDELVVTSVETKLAVHLVAKLVLKGFLVIDLDDVDDTETFVAAIRETRDAIREAMPMLDVIELAALADEDEDE